MKFFKRFCVTALLALAFVLPAFSMGTGTKQASAAVLKGNYTGYTQASDVKYVTSGNYVANWGARDEKCVFLSKYANSFYTGSYAYDTMSQKKGGTTEKSVPTSALYDALQTLMETKQTYQTSYDATKALYRYTDCVNSNYSYISSFYSGVQLNGTWGNGWNREHTWPNSKGDLSGNGENDIMMLRPTASTENSSRGNKAYGSSSGYYDPNGEGQSLRGDCARIVLFVYVRWGCINTGSKYNPNGIFGTNGVIESLDVLLQWIKDDPVDTWEMGRNDAVQSITGTRNVFVDYPEYAWLLFGRSVPSNLSTPSGEASGGAVTPPASSDKDSSVESSKPDSSIESSKPDSSVEDSSDVNSSVQGGAKPDSSVEEGGDETSSSVGGSNNGSNNPNCQEHEFGDWIVTKEATQMEDGERVRTCKHCGYEEKETLPMLFMQDLLTGCSASVGASMGGVLLALASCVVVDKMRKKKTK